MSPKLRRIAIDYGAALIVTAVASLIMLLLARYGAASLQKAPTLPFIASVIAAAWYGGFGPGILASGTAIYVINRFFSPPDEMNLDSLDLLRAITFVVVSTAVSWLGKARTRAEWSLRIRERQQAAVAQLGQQALAGGSLEELMEQTIALVSQTLGVTASRLLQRGGPHGGLVVRAERSTDPHRIHSMDTPHPGPKINSLQVVVPDARNAAGDWGRLTAEGRHRQFGEEDVLFLQAMANVLSTAVDRRRTERALSESEARTRAILATAADGIITVDENGKIESINPAAERLFGYTAVELMGRTAEILLVEPYRDHYPAYVRMISHRAPADRSAYQPASSPHRVGGVEAANLPPAREVAGRRKDGVVFPMDLAISVVPLPDRTLITGIARDATERKQLEQEILSISDRERRRIGQDLHDGLGQHLAGISFMSSALRRKLAEKQLTEANDADKIDNLVNQAIIHARTLSRGLYPVELHRGLRPALEELVVNIRQVFGIACKFECIQKVEAPEHIAAHLYRIAQEAVNNAIKHGRAPQVIVGLMQSGLETGNGHAYALTLRIEDNGSGFAEPPDTHRGMGLRIMEYRSRMIGGTLRIQRGMSGGTLVTCSLPVD